MNFEHGELKALVEKIFRAAGCSDDEATRVATRLVGSNLVGHDSHGVIRVPSYTEWLRDEKIFPNKSMQIVFENDAMAVVDGQFGLGQTIGEEATQLGIDKASKSGVAVIALRNSGHLGRIGDWAEMTAAADQISIHFVNTSGAGMLVAPFGGIDRRLSATPFTVGVPTGRDTNVILDMSACVIAEGKIRVALHSGKKVPDGAIIDSQGKPTNDPKVFYEEPGAILPIAGHKGFGLSLITDLLAGALSGGSCTNPEHGWRCVNNMLTVVIDPNVFAPDNAFHDEVQRFIDFVKEARTIEPDGEILMPGDLEERTKAKRLESGIEVDDTTWRMIRDTCLRLDVEHGFPEPRAS